MEYKVTKVSVVLKGGSLENTEVRNKYKIERIDSMKDVDGNDVSVLVHVRDITKEGVQAKINMLTTQITRLQEEKIEFEKVLEDIKLIEVE